jgi:homoserine kinase
VAAAEKAGAPAVTISGSGPSMIAIVDSRKTDPRKVAGRMRAAFRAKARVAVAEPGKPAKVTG